MRVLLQPAGVVECAYRGDGAHDGQVIAVGGH